MLLSDLRFCPASVVFALSFVPEEDTLEVSFVLGEAALSTVLVLTSDFLELNCLLSSRHPSGYY